MVSRSVYLNRMVFQNSSGDTILSFQIDNFPGGSTIFELVVKFCYGKKVELTPTNVAPLYCAAHFLEMSDDLEQGNLISKTEAFLSFLIFSSWKDTFRILKSCESISSLAGELQILKRCSEAVAWKVGTEPNELVTYDSPAYKGNNLNTGKGFDIWWFKDLSYLRIDHFVEVIDSIKRKRIRSEEVGSCIAYWTRKWLSRISLEFKNLNHKHMKIRLHRVTIGCLINLLPEEEKSVAFNFLLHLFRMGIIVKLDVELLNKLERRLAFMLESCRAADLLVKNYGFGDAVYDVGIVVRVVEAYVGLLYGNPLSRKQVVWRLVDEYLTLVARDENLPAKVYHALVEAMPKDSRYCGDNLYRAIDMYLKAHPNISEKERSDICRVIEYHKLSEDARKHAVKNGRLPLNVTTRFVLLEQVNMTRSITAGSNYQRTKSQAIMRVNKSIGKGWMNSQMEIKMMKQDVEAMKAQLSELHLCRVGLQKQAKRGIL